MGKKEHVPKSVVEKSLGSVVIFSSNQHFFKIDFSFHSHFHWHTLTVSFDASKYY